MIATLGYSDVYPKRQMWEEIAKESNAILVKKK
jgi:hypothetical protein